jgi:uncharacterized FAD-dependent dehydrogenase
MDCYDVGIIGAGIAGSFATLRIAEKHPQAKTILIDVGRPPGKRRRQIEGWLGCFPTGDGKIHEADLDKVKDIVDGRKATPAFNWVMDQLAQVNPMKLIRAPKVSAAAKKRIKGGNFDISYNDYYQWKPDSVHKLSKYMAGFIEEAGNVTFSFDNEVISVSKMDKNTFQITTANGTIYCNKIILCTGRSGWRWVTNLYDDLGIISSDDYAYYGVRLEINAGFLKDFNRSHLTIYDEELEVGPFCWNGTIIQEDHSDLVISAFRSNEDRWKSDKVSFSLVKSMYFPNNGSVQADRVGKLSFLLFNDRVSKERVKMFMNNDSLLNQLPEFDWLTSSLQRLNEVIPNLCNKGHLHVPNIVPMPAEINLGTNLESEIDGMFVAGESAGIFGIAAAATMGAICADSACK